jgi:putative polyketide hydroxylase
MSARDEIEVPVLIAGAGPTGLCASLLLSKHGIASLVVERHPGTSIYPRATGINIRSMEIFRSLGLEDGVHRASFAANARVARSRVLADPDPELSPPFRSETSDVSPCQWNSCSQFELEPVLRRAAEAGHQAQLWFGHELMGFEQTNEGICARVMDPVSGETREIRSRFLIGADGSKSPVRERLGIHMHGVGEIGKNVSVHFRSGLRNRLRYEANFLHFIQSEGAFGIFAPTDGHSQWVFAVPTSVAGETPSRERAVELVRLGAGMPDLDVDVLASVPWTMQADVAERWREGNVFLAGDAAHRMTPAGGLGLNTGVQDVHNLCWKLAAVIDGWASSSLLDTYEVERMPVGRYNMQRSVNLITGGDANGKSALEVDLGFTYTSAAIACEPASDDTLEAWLPSARPGARAPHAWVSEGSTRRSTLDLFGPHLTFLTGPCGEALSWTVRGQASAAGIPLRHEVVDAVDGARSWRDIYGIEESGAVMVRPDGHIAWRGRQASTEPIAEVAQGLIALASRREAERR